MHQCGGDKMKICINYANLTGKTSSTYYLHALNIFEIHNFYILIIYYLNPEIRKGYHTDKINTSDHGDQNQIKWFVEVVHAA